MINQSFQQSEQSSDLNKEGSAFDKGDQQYKKFFQKNQETTVLKEEDSDYGQEHDDGQDPNLDEYNQYTLFRKPIEKMMSEDSMQNINIKGEQKQTQDSSKKIYNKFAYNKDEPDNEDALNFAEVQSREMTESTMDNTNKRTTKKPILASQKSKTQDDDWQQSADHYQQQNLVSSKSKYFQKIKSQDTAPLQKNNFGMLGEKAEQNYDTVSQGSFAKLAQNNQGAQQFVSQSFYNQAKQADIQPQLSYYMNSDISFTQAQAPASGNIQNALPNQQYHDYRFNNPLCSPEQQHIQYPQYMQRHSNSSNNAPKFQSQPYGVQRAATAMGQLGAPIRQVNDYQNQMEAQYYQYQFPQPQTYQVPAAYQGQKVQNTLPQQQKYGAIGNQSQQYITQPIYEQYRQQPYKNANFGHPQIEEQQRKLIQDFGVLELTNQNYQASNQSPVNINNIEASPLSHDYMRKQAISNFNSQVPPGFENVTPQRLSNLDPSSMPFIQHINQAQMTVAPSNIYSVPQSVQQVQPGVSQSIGSSNVLIDQNESIIVNIMCKYDEASNLNQKLDALKGNILKLAVNQSGSKFLQKLLDNANPQIVQFLLQEIETCLPTLMVDNYGNYFCQRLLINCSIDQRMFILEKIADNFVTVCCNKKGTHTIQKFIDLVNLEHEEKYFQRVLAGHVVELSFDSQGTHVVQNIIKCFDESKRQFVFDEIYEQFIELSINNCGLCVIKVLIAKTFSYDNRKKLMGKLVSNAIELAQNPYGNYAIQQAFEHWDKEICQDLIPQFFGKVYQLSMQKCSSNVIDRCIQNSKTEYLAVILQELISCDRLNNLIMNSYGNFVVQNALKFASTEEKTKLADHIERSIANISDMKIKQKWAALLKRNDKSLANFKGFKSMDSDTSEKSYSSKKSIQNYGATPLEYQMYGYQKQNQSAGKNMKSPSPYSGHSMMPPPQSRIVPPSASPQQIGQQYYMMPTQVQNYYYMNQSQAYDPLQLQYHQVPQSLRNQQEQILQQQQNIPQQQYRQNDQQQ